MRGREVAFYFSAELPKDKIIELQQLIFKTSSLDHTKKLHRIEYTVKPVHNGHLSDSKKWPLFKNWLLFRGWSLKITINIEMLGITQAVGGR
jgi:hypothetical protein